MSSSGAEGSGGSSIGGGGGGGATADKDKLDALYEEREPKKIIRIITVTAYMVSVSFVGVALSAYYIFLWHPPNPRLMHSHALSGHSEARVEPMTPLGVAESAAAAAMPWPRLNVLSAADGASGGPTKTRRDVVSSVNAILRASYERSRRTSTAATLERDYDGAGDVTTPRLDNVAHTASILDGRSSSGGFIVDETTPEAPANGGKSTPATLAATTRRSAEQPVKKHHQTPFSLKHLQVPIKQDGSRRRWTKTSTGIPTSPSSSSSSISVATQGTALDKSSLPMATTDSSQVSDRPKLQDAVKNLFKTLTTTTSDRYREADYTTTAELTDIPSISSDQFEVIPRTNNDYQDSTAESVDDLLDD